MINIHWRWFWYWPKTFYNNKTKEYDEYSWYEPWIWIHLIEKNVKDFWKAFEKELLNDTNIIVHYNWFIDWKCEQRSHSIIIKPTHPQYKEFINEIIKEEKYENERFLYDKENALNFIKIWEKDFKYREKEIKKFENILKLI